VSEQLSSHADAGEFVFPIVLRSSVRTLRMALVSGIAHLAPPAPGQAGHNHLPDRQAVPRRAAARLRPSTDRMFFHRAPWAVPKRSGPLDDLTGHPAVVRPVSQPRQAAIRTGKIVRITRRFEADRIPTDIDRSSVTTAENPPIPTKVGSFRTTDLDVADLPGQNAWVASFSRVTRSPRVGHTLLPGVLAGIEHTTRVTDGLLKAVKSAEKFVAAGVFAGVSGRVCPPHSPGRNQVPITTSGGVRS
jgi:hypothetical protein